VTICCASSFCLFPALSRSSGVTHLQHTPLLAQDQRVAISDHVKVLHTPLPPLTHIPALSSLPRPLSRHHTVTCSSTYAIVPVPDGCLSMCFAQWIDANHESFRHPGGNNVINTDGFIKHVVNALKPH